MTIHLPEDLERYLSDQVQNGRFASRDEAISEAVRLLQRHDPTPVDAAENGGETRDLPSGPVPAWKRVIERMKNIPEAVFDRIPKDSSEQLDHYIYGTPKRPAS